MKLSDNEILNFLNGSDDESLFTLANKIRKKEVGDTVHIRGIIEFSNICRRNCAYCGLRAENRNIIRYRMSMDEIEKVSDEAYNLGYKTIVLQSGENMSYPIDMLAEIVHYISSKGITVALSIGELKKPDYRLLYEAGARRYLLKHETANEVVYNRLHQDSSFERRLRAIYDIKEAGYEVGGGFLIGLPDTDNEDILQDIRLIESVPLDMCGIGIFIPSQNTPLKDENMGSATMAKRAVALTRIILERANIPVTTSLRSVDNGRLFDFGANVIMTKLTPIKYRKLYDIYPLESNAYSMERERKDIEELIKSEGKKPL